MANVLYTPAKTILLEPTTLGLTSGTGLQLATDNIQAVLVDAGYTFAASDAFITSVLVGNRVATSANFTGQTVVDGVFDAADVTFSAVSGNQVTQVVVFKTTGTEATSPLIIYYDTITGLPVTPNGGDITLSWDATGIFSL